MGSALAALGTGAAGGAGLASLAGPAGAGLSSLASGDGMGALSSMANMGGKQQTPNHILDFLNSGSKNGMMPTHQFQNNQSSQTQPQNQPSLAEQMIAKLNMGNQS